MYLLATAVSMSVSTPPGAITLTVIFRRPKSADFPIECNISSGQRGTVERPKLTVGKAASESLHRRLYFRCRPRDSVRTWPEPTRMTGGSDVRRRRGGRRPAERRGIAL